MEPLDALDEHEPNVRVWDRDYTHAPDVEFPQARDYTYWTEERVEDWLWRRLRDTYRFQVERQAWGRYVDPLATRRARIDLLVAPLNPDLLHGETLFGIEVKAPHLAVGKPITQCIDYMKAEFPHPLSGTPTRLDRIFIAMWRGSRGGPIKSITYQNRIGHVTMRRGGQEYYRGPIKPDRIEFQAINVMTGRDGTYFEVYNDGEVMVPDDPSWKYVARKVGSR